MRSPYEDLVAAIARLVPEAPADLAARVEQLERDLAAIRKQLRGPRIERHITTSELSKTLGMSPDKLYRARDRGELSPVQVGRDLIWPVSEVQAWLDAHRQKRPRARLI